MIKLTIKTGNYPKLCIWWQTSYEQSIFRVISHLKKFDLIPDNEYEVNPNNEISIKLNFERY